MRVAVVGAGLAGLAAACHLRGRGHEVTVFERAGHPGGRAGRIDRDGFVFDTGPTVMTMPELLEEPLRAVGSSVEQAVPMRRLDPGYRAWYADGSTLDARADHDAMRAEIARVCGERDAAAYDEFVPWLRRLYETELPHFIDANFDSPLDLLRSPAAALRLVRLGAFDRLGRKVGSYFADERLVRLLSFQALYAGLPPQRALALYAVITYMDSVRGVWLPEGGMSAIPRGMARAARDAGVDFRYDAPVARVLRRGDGAACGVELAAGSSATSGRVAQRYAADAVVLTPDLPTAYRELLPGVRAPRSARTGVYSPSCVVWHLGVRGAPPPQAAHHNIHFGRDWDAAFDALTRDGALMPDPSRLVSIHSLSEPSLAPAGCTTLYVLEPVPNLDGDVAWRTERAAIRDRLGAFLADHGYPTDIVTEHLVDPLDWQADGMHRGTPFALAHLFAQTGPFRPGNLDRRVPGVVFAGSGTVPGVGVPMVLISGKLAADRVDAYAGRRPERPSGPLHPSRRGAGSTS